jgi:serine/threonine protein kinase
MAVSIEQFQRQLVDSGLIAADELRELLDGLPERAKTDAEQLARELVRQRRVTAFQVQQVYQGKGKHLVLGNYVVLDKLGQGGMGMVLKARHRRMKRLVALKMLSPTVTNTPEALRRFQREVEAAAKLRHQNIVAADDADEANGTHFLVMEYIEGTDLSAHVKKHGPLSLDKALHCVIQAARGLEYAHNRGVVHRDIKPANLLLDLEGTVKILDMGLARLDDAGTHHDDLTGTGQIMGTVDYMSPEQALDTKHADGRADIYSLGITLWYLLTGRPAYEASSTMAKLLAHRDREIPSLRAACPAVSPALDAVFARMVAKTPEARYQTMTDVIADLEHCQSGETAAPSVSAGPGEDSQLSAFLRGMEQPGGVPGMTAGAVAAKAARPSTSTRPAREQTVNLSSAAVDTDPRTDLSLAGGIAGGWPATQRTGVAWLDRLPIPPRLRMPALMGGGLGAAAILIAGILLFWQTDRGMVRIEINDPQITVQVDGAGATIKHLDDQPIELAPGRHGLRIKRGDLVFETDTFVLADGDDVRLKVELLAGRVHVAKGEDSLGVREVPNIAVVPPEGATPASVEDGSTTGQAAGQGGAGTAATASGDVSDWITLFDGGDLSAWCGVGGGALPVGWKIEGDSIVTPGSGTEIATVSEYGDFELEFDWKVAPGANGGVFYRWDGEGVPWPSAPEYQLVDNQGHRNGANPETSAGSVYGLFAPSADVTKPVGEWNQARIVVRGTEVEHWLNGERIVAYRFGSNEWKQRATRLSQGGNGPEFAVGGRGQIALQSNKGQVWYRKIRLRPLASGAAGRSDNGEASPPAAGFGPWQSLFDGRTLAGWKTQPAQPGDWSVKDGLLTGQGPASHLFSERGDFQDFHVRVEARINAGGNSGLYFRAEDGLTRNSGLFPHGYEAQILHRDPPLPGNTTGTLVRLQAAKEVPFKPDEWFVLEVVAQANHFIIKLNSETVVDFVDPKNTYQRGHFAIQLMDAGSVVQFKKIEVATPRTVASSGPVVKPLAELNTTGYETAPWISTDGLRLYYEGRTGVAGGLGCLMARRPAVGQPFAAGSLVAVARHPVLTADELQLVGIAAGNNGQLVSCRRASQDQPFPAPSPIAELASQTGPKSPWLSADGLLLVFQRRSGANIELVTCRRPDREAPWLAPEPIAGLSQVERGGTPPTWPCLSEDGLVLWYGHGGDRLTQVWRATRARPQTAFGDFQPFLVDGSPLVGRSPRYCSATGELFFARPVGEQDWELAVAR